MTLFTIYMVMGLFWTLTYILILRRTYIDRSPSIPLLAVGSNIAWESIHVIIFASVNFWFWIWVLFWLILDFCICVQFFTRQSFAVWTKRGFVLSVSILLSLLFFVWALQNGFSPLETSTILNAYISVLFLLMVVRKQNAGGLSLYIGLFKAIGTGILIIGTWTSPLISAPHPYMHYLFLTIIVFDILFILASTQKIIRAGFNPLMRL